LVVLGVLGHRHLTEIDKLMAGVESALLRIFDAFPGPGLRVISSLAEGADRLLAKRLLEVPHAHLWVALPLPEEEYRRDFATQASKEEFNHFMEIAEKVIILPKMENREKSYLAAANYLLENSECLLVLWDGKPAQGDGGTAETVNKARRRSLPLAWIHAGNHLPGTDIPTSLGTEQGKVTFERLPLHKRKKV
jgi:hypothetical protein